ncbi:hypothetical protein [Ekhidna sp.]|uniref:hypothetical protein n=1 Tax=Ekhidna sp. TaxID=2608089 RepID=UPI003BAAF488
MSNRVLIFSLFLTALAIGASAQRIVVDTASTNKYLLKPEEKKEKTEPVQQEPSFGDRAVSIGMGILNRLKARLNLDEAAESIKEKKEKILGKEEEEKKGGG